MAGIFQAANSGTSKRPEPGGLTPVHRAPFVGRDFEFGAIANCLEALRLSESQRLILYGESGQGKSRLAHETRRAAIALALPVIALACRGSEHNINMLMAQLIGLTLDVDLSLAPSEQQAYALMMLTGLGLDDLHPLARSLFQQTPDFVSSNLTPESQDLTYAVHAGIDAWVRILTAQARDGHPVVIIFEDLYEAHPAFVNAITYLFESIEGLPAFLLLTLGTEINDDHRQLFGTDLVNIRGFNEKTSTKFVRGYLQAEDLSPAFKDLLWEYTAGRPLFLTILAEGLQEMGFLERSADNIVSMVPDAEVNHIREYILEHVRDMEMGQRAALLGATVAGDGFSVELLTTLLHQVDGSAMVSDLDKLVDSGWLECIGNGLAGYYWFAHRVIREIVYERMDVGQRSQLHRRAGEYYASYNDLTSVQQAVRHFVAGENAVHGLKLLDSTLTDSYNQGNREQIIGLLQVGVEAAGSSQHLHEQQIGYVEALGDIYLAESQYEKAVRVYRDMGPRLSSVDLLCKLGLAELYAEPDKAITTLDQVIPLVPYHQGNDMRWIIEAGMAWGLVLIGQHYQALRHIRNAMSKLGEMSGFGSARSMLRGMLGMVLHYQGEQIEAAAHIESARAGWGARGEKDGVLLMNKVLIDVPADELTDAWLRMTLRPQIGRASQFMPES